MQTTRCPPSSRAIWPIILLLLAPAAAGDWLVTHDGARVETHGPWEVRGRQVLFKLPPAGTLSSMRLDEVDLDASRAATAEANRPPEPPPAEEAPQEPVLTLTDRDVSRGELGATGPQVLVDRLRSAHRYQDVGLAMSLVNWQGTPTPFRNFVEKEFEWLMGRQVRDVTVAEIESDANLDLVHNGVTYEPNVDVTHRLIVDLVRDTGDERSDFKVFVGALAGSYYITGARPVD